MAVEEIGSLQFVTEELPRAYLAEREVRVRPAVPGVSVGNILITAGTFGAVVTDNTTGRRVILSNAHVLTPDPSLPTVEDTRVIQPGTYDGGTASDLIANYTRHVTLSTTADNIVDCAIATPINDSDIGDEVMGIGRVAGTKEAFLGTRAQKSGRTSGGRDQRPGRRRARRRKGRLQRLRGHVHRRLHHRVHGGSRRQREQQGCEGVRGMGDVAMSPWTCVS
jgi:hypothetical protein